MAQALAKEINGPESDRQRPLEADAADRDEQRRAVAEAWLAWQCKMVAGVLRGAVFSVADERLNAVLAHWPASDDQGSALGILANEALAADDVLIKAAQKSLDNDQQAVDHIAIPISNEGSDYVVVMHIVARSQSQQAAVVQLVQWGGMWLGSLDNVVGNVVGSAGGVSIKLAEQVLSHNDLYAACLEAANTLAADLQCERVSVGLKKGAAIALQAISQVASFDDRRALVRVIESAMEEAADQQTIINMADPKAAELMMTRAHKELQTSQDGMLACTVPLYSNSDVIGAVLLERTDGLSADEVNSAAKVLAPMGPVLQLIKQEQRSYSARAREHVQSTFNRRKLPTTTKGKILAGAGCLGLLAFLFLPVPHNVSAQASIEGSDKQVLVAPQAGYVKSAHARAGDAVKAGQVIATLEDRDLLIEKEKWLGELGKLDTSLARALSLRDRSELGMLQAKKAQVDAELALIEQKINRSQLTAPFDGVLVSGDLNQSLGAPVDVGDVLFEVASMEAYRLVLEIDEHDVAGVEPNQPGVLRFSALPGNKHELTTKSIVPVAMVRDRKSVFSVEAELSQMSDKLRPGMRGVAKIRVGNAPLVWIWTHKLIAKMRLWVWKSGL